MHAEPFFVIQHPPKFSNRKSWQKGDIDFSDIELSRDLTLATWSKDHVALRVAASDDKSALCLVCCSWDFCKSIYNAFDFAGHLTRPPHWNVMGIYERQLLVACHHPDKLGDHSHCDRGDIMFLKGYMNLWVEAPYGKSQEYHIWCGHLSGASGDAKFVTLPDKSTVLEYRETLWVWAPSCISWPYQVW